MLYPDGIGRIFNSEFGILYEGEFKKSMWNGYGRVMFNKFLWNIGEFRYNCFHGNGKIYDISSGKMIEGYF